MASKDILSVVERIIGLIEPVETASINDVRNENLKTYSEMAMQMTKKIAKIAKTEKTDTNKEVIESAEKTLQEMFEVVAEVVL